LNLKKIQEFTFNGEMFVGALKLMSAARSIPRRAFLEEAFAPFYG
jgi:hypothetical protein